MTTYRIVRHFFKGEAQRRGLPSGLTLDEAQEHCKDPETSSKTCRKQSGPLSATDPRGPWFDGYEEE